ncbi:MAG: ABC transporter ATP-binding protein, partial [Candidatus Rokuibacteriota bacterium]
LQRRLGVTTIMVTHDQEEALAMADRIVVMNHGVVEQVGAPVEVYTRPRSPFVARFVGQMNFLEAVAGERSGWARLGAAEMRHGATEPIAAGTRLTLAIRPEEILVGPAAQGSENRLVTRIRAIQFLGPFTRLSLALPDGTPALECDVAAGAFAALGATEGSELALSLRPDALRVFPAAG